MQNTIKKFALEVLDSDEGRGFSLSNFALHGGDKFTGISLYDSPDEAESILEEIVGRGDLDSDEIKITEVFLHADGKILDGDEQELGSHIAKQTRQSEDKVLAGFKFCYAKEERRLRHAAEASSEGPKR